MAVVSKVITGQPVKASGVSALAVGEAAGGGGGGAELVFYDSYTVGASVNLVNYSGTDIDNTGLGYDVNSPTGGFLRVKTDGHLEVSSSANLSYYGIVSNTASDYVLEAGFDQASAAIGVTLALRHVDVDNRFMAFCFQTTNSKIFIFEVSGGTQTLRASSTNTTDNSEVSLWASDDGSTIRAGWDRGAEEVSYSSAVHNSSVKCGVSGRGSTFWNNWLSIYGGTTDPADIAVP